MLTMIVRSDRPVTLLGAGNLPQGALTATLELAPTLVCADGGADHALAEGQLPEAVIGDLDSLSAAARHSLPPARLHPIAEQDSTDFDKALRHIAAPLVLALGFEGGRIDHQLAVMNALLRHADRRCIVIGAEQILFLAPPELRLDLPIGSLLSLFPLSPLQGRSEGLRWPIEGLQFAPDGQIGTSNHVSGPVRLLFEQPGMLIILPRAALQSAMAGLQRCGAGWPAPAR